RFLISCGRAVVTKPGGHSKNVVLPAKLARMEGTPTRHRLIDSDDDFWGEGNAGSMEYDEDLSCISQITEQFNISAAGDSAKIASGDESVRGLAVASEILENLAGGEDDID